jgi:hypothetical protein
MASKHWAKFLWLLLPLLGLSELIAHVHFAKRFPTAEEWAAVEPDVSALKLPGDLLVVAPRWADPLARRAFGDALMPMRDAARADDTGYRRAIEVAARSESDPEVAGWPIVGERAIGRFVLRTRRNPQYEPIGFVLTDHASPAQLEVTESTAAGNDRCEFTAKGQRSAGGLFGYPAFPRERFVCGAREAEFVGTTIIDDQDYRPRRCLWANPGPGGTLSLRFSEVPLKNVIHGYAGLPYFIFRDHGWPALTISVSVEGTELGSYDPLPELGWQPFEFSTAQFRGTVRAVLFRITIADPRERQFCFYADTR